MADDKKETKTADPNDQFDIDALATAFIDKYKQKSASSDGDAALGAVSQLLSEGKRYRDTIRELREQVDGLKQQVPEKGTVAVPKAEYDALVAVMDENEKLSDFVKRAQRGFEAATTLQEREGDDVLREAAELSGYKFTVLRDRAKGLTVEIEGEGDERRAVIEADGKKVELVEYAEEAWADYLPALVAQEVEQRRRTFPTQPSGRRPPPSSPAKPVEQIKADKDRDKRYVAI